MSQNQQVMDVQKANENFSETRSTDEQANDGISCSLIDHEQPDGRKSDDIILSPEHLQHSSNPNVVLTNPTVLRYLQQLHERAKRKANNPSFSADDDIEERRKQLRVKVDAFNRRSQVGAFRVKLLEGSDELTYSGPLRFFYHAPGADTESFRMMTLSDRECVRDILPALRQRFGVPENLRCTLHEDINGDEILLDPDDRPLELAVNSRSPLTFHLVTGNDRNAELLQNLRNENFTPEQRRRFIEQFNLAKEKDFDDNDDDKSSVNSSSSTPRRRTSVSGSSTGSIKRVFSSRRKTASPLLMAAMAKLNGYGGGEQTTPSRIDDSHHSTPAHRPSNKTKLSRASSESQLKSMTLSTPPASQKNNSSTRTGRMRSVKQKNKSGTVAQRREPRSASARRLFLSLRKNRARSASRERTKDDARNAGDVSGGPAEGEDSTSSVKSTELSSDANLPGILKIFGGAVSPGANYKSVLATRQSDSCELVKMALQRYGIARQQAKQYVLCEVVGRVKKPAADKSPNALKIKSGKKKRKSAGTPTLDIDTAWSGAVDFVEDYVRPLSDYEKPLILQSYWKPLDGHCRRFEIRLRSQMFKKGEKDHATRDINNQARRLVMQKSKNSLVLSQMKSEPRTDSEDESEGDGVGQEGTVTSETTSEHKAEKSTSCVTEPIPVTPAESERADPETRLPAELTNKVGNALHDPRDQSLSSSSSNSSVDKKPASPCLITLQGDAPDMVYYLKLPETLIGRKASDVKLSAPDVAPHHCVIKRNIEIIFDERDGCEAAKRWSVTVTPLSSKAEVVANGRRLTSEYSMQHGDVIAVGKHYLFLFKDPMSSVDLSDKFTFGENDLKRRPGPAAHDATGRRGTEYPLDKVPAGQPVPIVRTELNYTLERENDVLKEIFESASKVNDSEYPFAPAALLCHCVLHSSLNFRLEHKNNLLLKVASNLQTLVLNATRNVSIQEIQSPSDPDNSLHVLLPALRPVVYWMSNSLEVFEFLQQDLIPIVRKRVREERLRKEVDSSLLDEAERFEVNEEILALLEEVVMYAFQQIVYYLTKTLYSLLPAVLDCNPFAESASAVRVEHVADVFESAKEMTRAFDVNPRITEQLFAYLFFFTNVSLFNTLMEEDSSSRYFKWEMGARIRGNLELIESWSSDAGCAEQCSMFLEKMSALASLLATPRTQIAKQTWTSFRESFPILHPAQLRHVLDHYRLPAGHSRPQSWTPDLAEINEASDSDMLMESYDNHPPLMLPVTGTRVQFDNLPTSERFLDLFNRVKNIGNSPQPYLKETVIAPSSVDDVLVGVRQQPEGREKTISDVTSYDGTTSSPEALSSKAINSATPARSNHSNHHLNDTASVGGVGRIVSSSSCSSSSSEPEGYSRLKKRQSQRGSVEKVSPSQAINALIKSDPKADSVEERGKDCDDLLLLPVSETHSVPSQVGRNKHEGHSSPGGTPRNLILPQEGAQGMPKEVFIVDIKKGRNGLGVGLVDGASTSLGVPGVFVRSLVPDMKGLKHGHSKHHDVIRCWLQEGRLQLGDRILAANGVSLLNMNYHEATKTVRQAGDYVRLLVGRCGPDVAVKITSSSC